MIQITVYSYLYCSAITSSESDNNKTDEWCDNKTSESCDNKTDEW